MHFTRWYYASSTNINASKNNTYKRYEAKSPEKCINHNFEGIHSVFILKEKCHFQIFFSLGILSLGILGKYTSYGLPVEFVTGSVHNQLIAFFILLQSRSAGLHHQYREFWPFNTGSGSACFLYLVESIKTRAPTITPLH